jgi:3-hydroxymyristoyl/3-hydroxydecanoyl-(acyl carrier protein) dehydratase
MQNPTDYLVYFTQINNAKFRKQVGPGDQLVMECELTGKKRNFVSMKAKAFVDNKLVCEAEFMAAVMEKSKEIAS